MSIVQFARFKSNNAEQVIKNARVAKKIFEKHGAEISSALAIPHGRVGGRVADNHAIRQLGSLRQSTGRSGEGRRLRETLVAANGDRRNDGP